MWDNGGQADSRGEAVLAGFLLSLTREGVRR